MKQAPQYDSVYGPILNPLGSLISRSYGGANQAEKRAKNCLNQCHYGDKKQKVKIQRGVSL